MNGRDLALGVVGALAVVGAVRRRGSGNTEDLECDPDAPQILYHLTNKKRFVINPTFVPREGVLITSTPTDPALFVTDDPSYWLNWRRGPKHVAVLDVSQLCFGGYRSVSRAGSERIAAEQARLTEERRSLGSAAEAFKQSLMMDGQPMPERLRSTAMGLSAPGAYPAVSFFADNPELRERARDSIEVLVRKGFATRASVDRAERAIAQADRKIEEAKRRVSTARSQALYDAYIPREGRYPEYILFPHAYDKVRVIETLPYTAAEQKYRSGYGWRTR